MIGILENSLKMLHGRDGKMETGFLHNQSAPPGAEEFATDKASSGSLLIAGHGMMG